MDAWPLGRYLKSVSLLRAICPSHMCLPLLSPFLIPLLRSMFFSSLRCRSCLLQRQACLTNVHNAYMIRFVHLFLSLCSFFLFCFGHLSILEESKQFVYEMCKWDMRRCDRDGIMEKTLIRLYLLLPLPAAERVLFETGKRFSQNFNLWKNENTCSQCLDGFQENHNVWPLYWSLTNAH